MGYRGEIKFKFKPTLNYINLGDKVHTKIHPSTYEVGDKVGQIVIMPYPSIKFIEVSKLSDSERGEGGFGSSGK